MTLTTEQAIVEAAILVLNEDYSAPLEKVAERAGVTRRTLHRCFSGREALLARCGQEMQRSCRQAVLQALASSDDPLVQLEQWVYAGVRCGVKYSFFVKLHTRPGHQHAPHEGDCAAYEALAAQCRALIRRLQQARAISPHLPVEWVLHVLNALVAGTSQAAATGSVALAQLEQLAWQSFRQGVSP